MITGFNTDIESEGIVYHVQTEDKGLETPFILSLVYDRGTILASKRQPYEDLFASGFDEKKLAARLQRQHSLMCAAVQTGRINDLIELTRREAQKHASREERHAAVIPSPADLEDGVAPIPKPSIAIAPPPMESTDAGPMVDVISILEDAIILPEEAVEVVSDLAGRDRTQHNRLCLEFVNETAFKGGERKSVTFMVCRGTERKVVGNAQILVKILGSNFRPQIFHSITDQNGLARLELEMPDFSGGRAAFLVRASSAGEETELRRSIQQS